MKTVCQIDSCAGCMACINICPKHAITIKDSLNAYNAIINETKCIDCKLCFKVCQTNTQHKFKEPIFWKQGWAEDRLIREFSSSGGVAQAIELSFIRLGGVVCSCIFEHGHFSFELAETEEQIQKFKGSKYVKSSPSRIYKNLKEQLKNGKHVLFVGLPCQVSAVKNYVGNDLSTNLYTIDLICHGTPSPRILDMFLKQYNLNLSDLSDIQFRSKTRFQLKENEKSIGIEGTLDKYSIGFLNSICYTENCYNCQYARMERISDITLGDSWGTKLSQEEQKHGISLVLCQTQKGKELLATSNLQLFDVDLSSAIKHNHQLEYPSIKPPMRDVFFKGLKSGKSFNVMIRKCFPKQCLKQCIKSILIKSKLYGGG